MPRPRRLYSRPTTITVSTLSAAFRFSKSRKAASVRGPGGFRCNASGRPTRASSIIGPAVFIGCRTTTAEARRWSCIAGISDTFSGSGTNWVTDKRDGATLIVDGQGYWNYTARDGTKIKFGQQPGEKSSNCPGSDASQCRVPLSITAPNGLKFNLTWGEVTLSSKKYRRLTGVASSAGYSLAITYLTNNAGSGSSPVANWWKRNSVTFTNSANPPNPLPTITYAYPNATTIDVTDPAGRSWRFTTDFNGRLAGVRRPGSTSNDISYAYATGASATVNSATKDGVTNTYNRAGGVATISNPLGQQKIVMIDVDKS